MVIAAAMSILFFSHYDHLRDKLADRYLDGYSVYYYEDSHDYGRSYFAADASTKSFSGKVILYLSQWVMIDLTPYEFLKEQNNSLQKQKLNLNMVHTMG